HGGPPGSRRRRGHAGGGRRHRLRAQRASLGHRLPPDPDRRSPRPAQTRRRRTPGRPPVPVGSTGRLPPLLRPNLGPLAPARDLQRAGAELVLSGHDHSYERFAPQTSTGRRDARRGIVQFVVGTGGENHYPIFRAKPNSLVRNNFTFGVLGLTLRSGSYAWRFVPEAGSSFTASGSGRSH